MTYILKSLEVGSYQQAKSLLLVRDIAETHTPADGKSELRAQVASNDYFILLATQLDKVSQSLSEQQKSDYLLLEDAIQDLLYLHEHYKIIKK